MRPHKVSYKVSDRFDTLCDLLLELLNCTVLGSFTFTFSPLRGSYSTPSSTTYVISLTLTVYSICLVFVFLFYDSAEY